MYYNRLRYVSLSNISYFPYLISTNSFYNLLDNPKKIQSSLNNNSDFFPIKFIFVEVLCTLKIPLFNDEIYYHSPCMKEYKLYKMDKN